MNCQLMGILNVTPDSFSDGGMFFSRNAAVQRGVQMMEEGADIIDVGGESTRPGAAPIELEEEINRTIPVVHELSKMGIPVSIDTYKAEVARMAMDAGGKMINDVTAGSDPRMVLLAAEYSASVCFMHMKGTPRTMQKDPQYGDVVAEVKDYLVQRCQKLIDLKIPKDRIFIDPGIGFGKTYTHNLELIARFEELSQTGFATLIGVSRKSFIGRILSGSSDAGSVEERLEGTLIAQSICQQKGARMIRAHDVIQARRAMKFVDALMQVAG